MWLLFASFKNICNPLVAQSFKTPLIVTKSLKQQQQQDGGNTGGSGGVAVTSSGGTAVSGDSGALETMSVVESLVKLGEKQPTDAENGATQETPEVRMDQSHMLDVKAVPNYFFPSIFSFFYVGLWCVLTDDGFTSKCLSWNQPLQF